MTVWVACITILNETAIKHQPLHLASATLHAHLSDDPTVSFHLSASEKLTQNWIHEMRLMLDEQPLRTCPHR
jgi:hypothetical protein